MLAWRRFCSYCIRIGAVAHAELRGILRSHPFRIFVPVAVLVVLGVPKLVLFAFDEKEAMVAQLGVSTAALFSSLLALLAGAGSLARERECGLGDQILVRPIGALGYVAGKWLGILAASTLAVAVLGGVHLVLLTLRGGPPLGYGPLCAALVVAVIQAGLAAAASLLFSARFRPGPAFLAALLFLAAGHLAFLLPEGSAAARYLLPRAAALNLAGEAAFGPFPPALWLLAGLHGLLYSAFLVTLASRLAVAWRKT